MLTAQDSPVLTLPSGLSIPEAGGCCGSRAVPRLSPEPCAFLCPRHRGSFVLSAELPVLLGALTPGGHDPHTHVWPAQLPTWLCCPLGGDRHSQPDTGAVCCSCPPVLLCHLCGLVSRSPPRARVSPLLLLFIKLSKGHCSSCLPILSFQDHAQEMSLSPSAFPQNLSQWDRGTEEVQNWRCCSKVLG